jgi:hypothetical protein
VDLTFGNEMKSAPRIFGITTAAIILSVVLGFAALVAVQGHASNKVLTAIQTITPGQDISVIRQRLGKEMHEIKDTGRMLSIGTLKDPDFCKDKTLYWFYISTPPCRVVEVYTDQAGKVAFVTWQGL